MSCRKWFASVAQLVARILGKDEVGGSSPLGSFYKTLEISRFQGFSFCLIIINAPNSHFMGNFWGTFSPKNPYLCFFAKE